MPVHKYHVGQLVTLVAQRGSQSAPGLYTVTRLLPAGADGEPAQYRLKSTVENHERVAAEHLLVPAATVRG
jgi:hypothetical protein